MAGESVGIVKVEDVSFNGGREVEEELVTPVIFAPLLTVAVDVKFVVFVVGCSGVVVVVGCCVVVVVVVGCCVVVVVVVVGCAVVVVVVVNSGVVVSGISSSLSVKNVDIISKLIIIIICTKMASQSGHKMSSSNFQK